MIQLRTIAVLFLLCVPASAGAAFVSYSDEAEFFAAASANDSLIVSTMTFDEGTPPEPGEWSYSNVGNPVSYDGITYTTDYPGNFFVGNILGAYSGFAAISVPEVIQAQTLSFWPQLTNAIGFYMWFDGYSSPIASYDITAITNDGELLVIHRENLYATPVYCGFVSSQGIKSVSINPWPAGASSAGNFAIDDVSRADLKNRPGDANVDGFIDGADYTAWANHFLQTNATWSTGDFNGDGLVDGADYTIWANHFEPAPLVLVSAVPEPSTLALAGIGSLVLLAGTVRRRLSTTG